MNVTCSSPVCPVILNSTCVFYEGESLIYTGINTNDSLQTALQKIDAALGLTTVVNIYNSDGTLTGNRTISSGGFTLTIQPVTTFTAAPAISTLTQGSVLFAGSGGTISQNNSQFFWDNTNNRLGLGIINPLYTLDVSGTARIVSTLEVDSLAGIGNRMVVADAGGILSTQAIPTGNVTGSGSIGQVAFWNSPSSLTGTTTFYWDNFNGRLGVGNPSPTRTLDVLGSFSVNGSIISLTNSSNSGDIFIGNDSYLSMASTRFRGFGSVFQFQDASYGTKINFNMSTGGHSWFNTGGNYTFGATSDGGQRLQVQGTTLLNGNVAVGDGSFIRSTSTTAGGIRFVSGDVVFYNTSNNAFATFTTGTTGVSSTFESVAFNAGLTGTRTFNNTSGTSQFVAINNTFSPASGTGVLNVVTIATTVNQAGGANGAVRGLYINPTLTLAADFRAIEVSAGISVLAPSTTTSASLRIPAGVAPTTPTNGDVWSTTTDLLARINGTTYSLINSGLSGSGAAGQVTFWNSPSNITGSNNLFWDNATSRLGIGTNTPGYQLSVANSIRTGSHTIHLDGCFGCANNLVISHDNAVGTIDVNGTSPSCDLLFRTKGVERMRLFGVTGNLLIQNGGTFTDNTTYRLQVQGDAFIKGSGNNINSTSLLVQNSDAANILRVRNDKLVGINILTTDTYNGSLQVNANASNRIALLGSLEITNSGGPQWSGVGIQVVGVNRTLTLFGPAGSSLNALDNARVLFGASGGNYTRTSGTAINVHITDTSFAPTSGNATYAGLQIDSTINQVGSTGTTRGLYVNPTLTAAADWRGIEVVNGTNTTYIGRNTGSATVQIDSTTQGFLPPRMTLAQKNAIATPAEGLIVYQTDGTKGLYVYDGASWRAITII